jgi:UDP-N-acetylmuramoylalanine--D-glutamate ligase
MSGVFPPVFAGSRFAVLGLGSNGLPAARALAAMGAEVIAWDDDQAVRAAAHGVRLADPREISPGFDAPSLDALVLSPGIPHSFPAPHPAAARAIALGIPILSDAELLFRAVRAAGSRASFIGVTGTNGKSTTTALIAHILKSAALPHAAGGNLGPAALALPLLPDAGHYIIEMSSYMLERIDQLRFDIAILLNLSPDHLDRHGGMAGYIAAKRRIFAHREADGLAILGIDDPLSRALAASLTSRLICISGEHPADVWCESGTLCDRAGSILAMHEAPALPGTHNAQNAAAAAAATLALGLARPAVAAAMRSFPGLPHRQQLICRVDGIAFVNDSKATNADSAARALACYERVVWIAGGIAKDGGIEPLAPFFPRVAEALLIGRDAPLFAATLARHNVPHRIVAHLDEAVPAALAAAQAHAAPVVLLSPAAASFDQFRGFPERGEFFSRLARALCSQAGKAA